MENIQKSLEISQSMSCRTNIPLTALHSEFGNIAVNETLQDYDAKQGSILDNNDITNMVHSVFADSWFGPTQSCVFIVVLLKGDKDSYWLARVFFSLLSNQMASLRVVKSLPFCKISRQRHLWTRLTENWTSFLLRTATDNEIHHSMNFNRGYSRKIESVYITGLVNFFSLFVLII